MVRKLKRHEQKLLRKVRYTLSFFANSQHTNREEQVDFTTYKSDANHRQSEICRRYVIQNTQDYQKYNRLCGDLKKLAHKLAALDPSDPVRRKHEGMCYQVIPLL